MTTTGVTSPGQVQIGGDANDFRVVCQPVVAATDFANASGLFVMNDFNPWTWADTKYESIPWLFRPGVQAGPDQVLTRKVEFSVLAKARSGGLGTGDARQTLRNLVAKMQRACRPRADLSELGWFYSASQSSLAENDFTPGVGGNFLVGRYQELSMVQPQQVNLARPWVKMKVRFEATEPFTYGTTQLVDATSIVPNNTLISRPLTFPLSGYWAFWNTLGAVAPTLQGDSQAQPRVSVTVTGSQMYCPTLVALWTDGSVGVLGIGNSTADAVQLQPADQLVFDWANRTVSLNGADVTSRLTLGSTWFPWSSLKGTPKLILGTQGSVPSGSGTSSSTGASATIRYFPGFYLMG